MKGEWLSRGPEGQTWYANKEAVDEVTAAVEAWTNLVPGSHLGILQGDLDLLMVQVFWCFWAGGQTADRTRGSREQKGRAVYQPIAELNLEVTIKLIE